MLLFIDACIRGEESRTKALCEAFLAEYIKLNPSETIKRVELAGGEFEPLTHHDLENTSDERNKAAKKFAGADKIIIGAPYWDFSFPAVLKCYIEHICLKDTAFRYCDDEGLVGLCKADKLLYICTAGGAIEGENHGFAYIKEVGSKLLGIKEFFYIDAQELDIVGKDIKKIMSEAADKVVKAAGLF